MVAPTLNATREQLQAPGPQSSVLIADGAYTAAGTYEFSVGPDHTVVEAVIWCSLDPAAASVTMSLEGYDPGQNNWESLITAAAIADVNTQKFISVNPYSAAVTNVSCQRPVRRRMRVRIAVADTDSLTYSVTINTR